ncbi:MAG: hypothetical protein JWP44_4388 [Mucilaginibacter sp.]|nr:hypothetical protein [Mucilaginibacter sp.]
MNLSPRMSALVEFMKAGDGSVYRHPGGHWRRSKTWDGDSFGASSVEALVKRGVAEYTDWQEGRNGRFPIRATLKAHASAQTVKS